MQLKVRYHQLPLVRRLELPVLLLLIAAYYWHTMAGYVAPIWTPDEFGYMSVAALLNGHNWTAVANHMPWYSYGYSLLLAPVFALTDASHWYTVAQVVNITLVVLTGVCANLLLRRLDATIKPWLRHFVVIIVLLYPSVLFNARLAWPETLIALIPWLVAFLLYRLFELPRRYVNAFALGCLLMAAYYVHSRLIVLFIAAAMVLVFAAIRVRRWRELAIVISGAIVVLLPAHWFKGFLIEHLYGGAVLGVQASPLKVLSAFLHRIKDVAAWRDLVGSAGGQLAYQVIATLGLLVVGVVASLKKLHSYYVAQDWAGGAAVAFVLLGAIGSYALVLLTMGMSPQYPQHVFYGRYTEPLVLPLVALGLLYLYHKPRSAPFWLLLSLAFASIAVPVGVHAAAALSQQTTYWTAILGLFTYRSLHWYLRTGPLLIGFSLVTACMVAAFCVHRAAGLALVALLFFCAGFGLVQNYAPATPAYAWQWKAWPLRGAHGTSPRLLRLEAPHDALYLTSTRIQVINPSSVVVPPRMAMPSDFSGVYERMAMTGSDAPVERLRCVATAGVTSIASCTPIPAPPDAAVQARLLVGKSVSVRRAGLPRRIQQFLVTLPYLRAVWNQVALAHVAVRCTVQAAAAQGLSIVVFVTQPAQVQQLTNATVFRYVPAGSHTEVIHVPVPVRNYLGQRLPKGVYTLHVLVSAVGSGTTLAATSAPMRVR